MRILGRGVLHSAGMRLHLRACLIVSLGLATASTMAGCAQQFHEVQWPDLVTARQQDAIDRGWVPEFLPEDATDVRMRTESAAGTVVVVANLAQDVALPECDGASTVPVPSAPEWFPTGDVDDAASCGDGWHAARSGSTVALWHVPEPATPTSSPS